MLLDMTKAHYANDNHDTWISLAAATARLLKSTEQEKQRAENGPDNRQNKQNGVCSIDDSRRDIDQRLAEPAKWEQRIRDGRMRVKRR